MQFTHLKGIDTWQWLGRALIRSMLSKCMSIVGHLKFHFRLELFRRMQTSKPLSGSPSPSTMSIIHSSISQFGLRNMYAGLTASFMRQMSYSLVRIGSYEKIKEHLSRNGKPSTLQLLLAASLAGALGGIAGNPSGALFMDRFKFAGLMPRPRYHSCSHDK